MENKEKPTKIDSWEPSVEHEFKYPKGREIPKKVSEKIEEDLTPELIKAFKEGLKISGLPDVNKA